MPRTPARSARPAKSDRFARAAVAGLLLSGAACAFADVQPGAEPASAPSAQTTRALLDLARCDAYRDTMSSVRSRKDLGTVDLRFDVSTTGEVLGGQVLHRTTSNHFALVALQDFSQCPFKPATEKGVAVAGHAKVHLNFGMRVRRPNNAECPSPSTREQPPAAGPLLATTLRIRFQETGGVAGVDVLQPSGMQVLDDAAVAAFRQCHFDPHAAGQPPFQEAWTTTVKWAR